MDMGTQNNWKIVKFKDFAKLQRGFDLPQQDRIDGQYPVVASTSITAFHNQYKVKAPCVTTGRSGALGEVLYINVDCWPLNTALYVKDFHGNNPRFVYYKLKTLGLEKFNAGAGVPTLNKNHLDTLEVKIPDFHTQTRIASVLSAYDDLIENNEKRIKALEEIAQLLYAEWFVKFKFPGHEKVKMVESGTEYGMVPEGWEVKKIKDVSKVITGKTPSTNNLDNFDGKILFIKTPDIHGNIFILETEQTLSEVGAKSQLSKLLPEKTVFVSCIGTIGIVGITSKPSQTNQQINALLTNDKSDYCMVYFFVKDLKRKLIGLGSNGATMGNVNKDKFENINILYSSKEVRKAFFQLISVLFDKILMLQKQNKNLSKARDLLIPQLVTGKRELK